jgi:hypothetical protein
MGENLTIPHRATLHQKHNSRMMPEALSLKRLKADEYNMPRYQRAYSSGQGPTFSGPSTDDGIFTHSSIRLTAKTSTLMQPKAFSDQIVERHMFTSAKSDSAYLLMGDAARFVAYSKASDLP